MRHKQPKALNDSVRKKVTKRKHRWMRIVTFQWKHHQMKTNTVYHVLCVAKLRGKRRKSEGKGETKGKKREERR